MSIPLKSNFIIFRHVRKQGKDNQLNEAVILEVVNSVDTYAQAINWLNLEGVENEGYQIVEVFKKEEE